jgi:hypothetical protein
MVLSAIWPRTGSQLRQLRLQSLLPNWRGAPDLADEACKNAYGEGVGPKPWQEEDILSSWGRRLARRWSS